LLDLPVGVVLPARWAELARAHDIGADARLVLLGERVVDARGAALASQDRGTEAGGEHPLDQPLAGVPDGRVGCLALAGRERSRSPCALLAVTLPLSTEAVMQNPSASAEAPGEKPVVVLMASCLLGPAAWDPVAEHLRSLGWDVVIAPDDGFAASTPEDAAEAYAAAVPSDHPVILVPHSNAGNFIPFLIASRTISSVVFVDAVIPVESGTQRLVPAALVAALESLTNDTGMLPPWTTWFDEADVAPLFPDPATRSRIEAKQPKLPIGFLLGQLEIETGWNKTPSAYLAFGSTYAEEQKRAEAAGWPVVTLNGRHLHMLIDPVNVASEIIALARP
jgi:hypothetical protein